MNLATVMSTTPDLTVRNDGDTVDVPARTTDTVVAVNDRVLVEFIDNVVYILGRLTAAITTDPTPAGVILPWSSSVAPLGYLMCQFQAVLRADYPNLNAIAAANGYTGLYGPGNGTTTFNVPDGRGRTFVGAGTFAAFGVTDGLSESARTLRHVHPLPNEVGHNHTVNDGGGHAHNISDAADHGHNIPATNHAGTNNATGANTGGSLDRVQQINGTPGGSHAHGGNTGQSGSHAHGGNTGSEAAHNHGGNTQNSGAHDHGGATTESALNALPFFAGHYIIKY